MGFTDSCDGCGLKDNEKKMRKDILEEGKAIYVQAAGIKNVVTHDGGHEIGDGIHEMGTAHGQRSQNFRIKQMEPGLGCTECFVTDGAFMVSSTCQNLR